ncbi:unnamed protein product [Caenorhabditis auriculariae]|uniref:Uncharacterized protein n=1 Tax=Caenorhabditis auriculariae TaxID=2777116 RepID=A0A8S1GM32_9PELO|nr:unnamed protein product [Caenorhabditis auriculariae]
MFLSVFRIIFLPGMENRRVFNQRSVIGCIGSKKKKSFRLLMFHVCVFFIVGLSRSSYLTAAVSTRVHTHFFTHFLWRSGTGTEKEERNGGRLVVVLNVVGRPSGRLAPRNASVSLPLPRFSPFSIAHSLIALSNELSTQPLLSFSRIDASVALFHSPILALHLSLLIIFDAL